MNKEWKIGDVVDSTEIRDAIEWCNSYGDRYPKLLTTLESGNETWVLSMADPIPQPSLEDVKKEKYSENDTKAETFRESQSFTVTFGDTTLVFVTNRKTQGDLQNLEIAFLRNPSTTYDWTDEEGTQFTFTSIEQVDEIEAIFKEKVNVYDKWAYFKNLIDEATTVDEVRSIVIDYGINL